jgi:hypothetical protein
MKARLGVQEGSSDKSRLPGRINADPPFLNCRVFRTVAILTEFDPPKSVEQLTGQPIIDRLQ